MLYVDPNSSPLGGGWEGATDLVRAQWDQAHAPARFTPAQDDEDGAAINVCTLTKLLEYFNVTQSESKAKLEVRKNIYDHIFDNYETLYTSLETNSELPSPVEEVDNIDGWSVRASSLSSNNKGFLYERILKKIEEAKNETSISFSLFAKGIYLGKAKINEHDYNLAILLIMKTSALKSF